MSLHNDSLPSAGNALLCSQADSLRLLAVSPSAVVEVLLDDVQDVIDALLAVRWAQVPGQRAESVGRCPGCTRRVRR